MHQNARTTRHRRMLMIERLQGGWPVPAVAAALGVDPKTVRKGRDRYAAEGAAGLRDRSSRPHHSPTRLDAGVAAEIERLRRQRLSGPAIARCLGRPISTIGAVLRRRGLGRLASLEPRPPVIRYERAHPGELIHLDIKKLGRIAGLGHRITGDRRGQSAKRGTGWEDLHVAVDDASRLAYTELLPDEKKESATAFLKAALAYYQSLGVTVARVMTDNGSCYKAFDFRNACRDLGLKHIRTRPYTPKTNGKAERFIQSALREWAYAQPYTHSDRRTAELPRWLHRYNWHRPHGSLDAQTPISRLGLSEDNLLRLHI
jgi:transposase InsO family protein